MIRFYIITAYVTRHLIIFTAPSKGAARIFGNLALNALKLIGKTNTYLVSYLLILEVGFELSINNYEKCSNRNKRILLQLTLKASSSAECWQQQMAL